MRRFDQLARLAAGVAIAAMTVGCSAPSTGPAVPTPNPATAAAAVASNPSASALDPLTRPVSAPGARPSKVLVVVAENHTPASALQDMPFLASLAGSYGQALNYHAVTHPSLPNYLAIAGGSTFGVTDDNPPADHAVAGFSVFDQAIAAGATAKTYAEAMPGPCALTSSDTYAVKHNPWAYFSDPAARANCRRYDLPAGTPTDGELHDDILAGTLPTVGLLVPDMCNDGHDCPLATADAWLQTWISAAMQGPDYQAGKLAIVVTFDEDDHSGPNTVLTVVIAPTIDHRTATIELDHYSLTRYLSELAGITPPGESANSLSLRDAFGI